MKKSILLIESNENMYRNLRFILGYTHFNVTWLNSEKEVLKHNGGNIYDCIVIDQEPDAFNIVTILPHLRKNFKAPVLIITPCAERFAQILPLLNCEYESFVRKPLAFQELNYKVNEMIDRYQIYLQYHKKDKPSSALFVINRKRKSITYCNQSLKATLYERRLLEAFLKNPLQVFSYEKIHVIGTGDENSCVAKHTVVSHMSNLRKRLRSISKDYEFIISRRGVGYAFCKKEAYEELQGKLVCAVGEE